jgi:hypothetical protein
MKPSLIINIPKQFSKFPAGRYRQHGDFSGEQFRDEFLVKAFKDAEKVLVVLDGAAGYGSSFLEEAFGGLIRKHGFRKDDLKRRLEIQSEDKSLIGEIWDYIDQESVRQNS